MSVKKLVSIKESVTQFLDETVDGNISMMPKLIRWAKQSDLRIGSYYSYKKKYYLRTVSNGFVDLPLSIAHVLGVVLGNHLDQCPDIFNTYSSMSQETAGILDGYPHIYMWDDISGPTIRTRFQWEIQDNSIVFPGSVYDGNEVTIACLSYEEDADGFPMILETHIQALACYLKIKAFERELWVKSMKGQVTRADLELKKEYRDEYRFEVRQAVANDGDWNDNEIEEIGKMLGHPFTGNGSLNLY